MCVLIQRERFTTKLILSCLVVEQLLAQPKAYFGNKGKQRPYRKIFATAEIGTNSKFCVKIPHNLPFLSHWVPTNSRWHEDCDKKS